MRIPGPRTALPPPPRGRNYGVKPVHTDKPNPPRYREVCLYANDTVVARERIPMHDGSDATNCPNCGARLQHGLCGYCGTGR